MRQAHGPFLVVPSRHGSVPNLTPDQARQILMADERLISTSVLDAQEFVQGCASSKMSFAQFCGLNDFRVLLPVRSSFQGVHSSAPSSDKQLSGDHEKGRLSVSFPQWKATVTALRPDYAVAMHESVPLNEPTSRRRRTAQTRTETWVDQTVQSTSGDPESHVTILYPFSCNRDGVPIVVDALPRNENLLEYATSLRTATHDFHGVSFCVATSLPAYLAALCSGVQLIECPVAWDLAACGIALTLSLQDENHGSANPAEPQIDLNDAAFALDIGPLAEHCDCFACRRHCRAYVHHLLTVQEMNSDILLTIHNLTQLVAMCRRYRMGTTAERERLMERVIAQL